MGLHAPAVCVEVHLSGGLPSLSIVGLPETAVRESKDRVRSALINAGFEFPLKRITINLAPADLPKEGARFDLPIALGILAASAQIPADALVAVECVGELALDGSLRPIRGALPTALAASAAGHDLLLPEASAAEAGLAVDARVHGAAGLREVCAHLSGERRLCTWVAPPPLHDPAGAAQPDLAEVRGQVLAKRALEVAAAGGHHLLYLGSPGSGKSMLAQRLIPILPPMEPAMAAASAAIASVSRQGFLLDSWRRRPFRAPHHTASSVALVGGGSPPRPGEVSLAHGGVLFLDELPEFDRFHRERRAPGVAVVGLAVDGPTPVRQFLARQPLGFGIGLAGFDGAELAGNSIALLVLETLARLTGRDDWREKARRTAAYYAARLHGAPAAMPPRVPCSSQPM